MSRCTDRKLVVYRVFDDVLVDESETFVNFFITRGVRKLPQSLFLVEFGLPNNDCASFSAALITVSLRSFRLFSANHSSEERLENLAFRLNLSLLIS